MKLMLVGDDGSVIDSVDITLDEFDTAAASPYDARDLINQLSTHDVPRADPR